MQAAKLLITFICAAFIAAVCAAAPASVAFDGASEYIFYAGTSSADCREIKAESGFGLVKSALPDVCGECAVYPAEGFSLQTFLKKYNAETLFCEQLSDSVNYYCRADLPYSATLYGQEINLHICIRADGVMAASPIIFGGY